MPMVPGLNPFLRQDAAPQPEAPEGAAGDIQVNLPPDLADIGAALTLEHDDGSVSVSLDGKPIVEDGEAAERSEEWFRNLVDDIDGNTLSQIGEELLRGVSDDLTSRQDWIEDRAQGLKLLGLKIEIPGLEGASDGAPVEGMSKVRHPLLLEAVLRFQANARSELLPTSGPVKVENTATNAPIEQDQLATSLERDMNYYLTSIDKEYYPDTDRMLLMLGFGGTSFKKVYFCPLRGRPVSESVDADDLIVNNSATTLGNAKRVTHRIYMRPSTVKRMQIIGAYRDLDLSTPVQATGDAAQQERDSIQGVMSDAMNPDDRDREIYEVYCELDIPGFEHKHKGRVTGLEIPYRVTIDVSSREILSIVRNYDEPEEGGDGLPEARTIFIKYSFVPGLGFYDIGLLHILGNTTNAVTAAWREMLDAGMYANFPGFLVADTGGRQNTNIFRIPPGGGAQVKTNGLPINQAVMPLPYKEPGQALMNLVANMVETGQRVGGTSELQVGEGRQDAPVGTTIALIDQAVKVMNAVHKRLHAAQGEEFQLLVRCFREHPDSFWGKNKKPAIKWDEQTFMKALDDYDLVPQADPNTPSHMQRVMKVMALKQLQMANPAMYNAMAVDTAALSTLGWSNPEQFLVQPNPNQPPPPEIAIKQQELAIKKQDADAKLMKTQAEVAKIQHEIQTAGMEGAPQLDPNKMAELELKKMDLQQRMMEARLHQQQVEAEMQRAQMDMVMKHQQIDADRETAEMKLQDDRMEAENRMRDRESKERLAAVKLAQDVMRTPGGKGAIKGILDGGMLRRLRDDETPIGGL